jgi:predicted O-methyltransferase YrrM
MDERNREACVRYVTDLFASEDDVLARLRREAVGAGLPQISIDADEGKLLQVLLRAVGAHRVVELGTLGGYSAIWMARALPENGLLITLEREPGRAELARRFIEQAGLAKRVDVRLGAAAELLPEIAEEGPFDAVFIDADKQSYPFYLEWCAANVRAGGLVVADNAFQKGRVLEADATDPDVLGIREFNRRLAGDRRFTSIVVPTRDGTVLGRWAWRHRGSLPYCRCPRLR